MSIKFTEFAYSIEQKILHSLDRSHPCTNSCNFTIVLYTHTLSTIHHSSACLKFCFIVNYRFPTRGTRALFFDLCYFSPSRPSVS